MIYNKNNNSYRNIIVLCVLKGLIASDKEGDERFKKFQMKRRYIEYKILKEYFRKHYNLNLDQEIYL